MSIYSKVALFVGGTLFGSLGVKLLTSKDARKAYAHVTAAGLRAKDYIMDNVTKAQENIADIVAEAKDINEDRRIKEETAIIEDEIDELGEIDE